MIPYFGKWPAYFSLFLKGCEANTWMDVWFFTDCEPPSRNYSNVYFHTSSLEGFSLLASEKLGFPVQVEQPYKLCDFKPLYGKIYEDHIGDYDYWAYGDIDLIYGDLMQAVYPRLKKGFDVLSFREEILSGSLVFLKNISQVNGLLTHLPGLACMLNDSNYFGLDETCHSNITWEGKPKSDLPKNSFTYIVNELSGEGKLQASFVSACKEYIYPGEVIVYKDDKLTCGQSEMAYYHFVCHKSKAEFRMPSWRSVPGEFYITRTGFYTANQYRFLPFINSIRIFSGLLKRAARKLRKVSTHG
ncbi:MAG TPA: DUF6625 family protein [Flavisolibacter sp.]|nr:DUF6625 family protein [Flavisolibacter sp.]